MPREMKDSETKWLGDIPYSWNITRIGSLYTLRNTKVSDYDYQPLSVTMNGVVPQLETAAKTNAHDDRKLVKKGDFAINSRSDRRGSCGISEIDGSVSLINTILSPNTEMNPRYYNWLFHTFQFADEFYANGHGIVDDLWTTGWQEMKKILIPVPSLAEQETIAHYLDTQCSEIDSLISDIQSEIETLENYKKSVITEAVTKGLNTDVEIKDSGIEWIGKIPSHWEIKKIKHATKVRNQKWTKSNGQLDYFALENIVSWQYKYIKTENEYDLDGSQICKKDDVVFGKLRPYLAKTFIVDCDRCCSSEFAVFYNFSGLQKFLLYLVTSYGFVNIVDMSTQGTKMPRANIEYIKNMYIPLPNETEQKTIVEYLDSKCSDIDGAIEEKKEQLKTLEELKKSLIYEYVTGKKEVPAE